MSSQAPENRGITFRSVAVCCLSILLLAILIQFFEIIEGSFMSSQGSIAQSPLAVPAILIFLILLIVGSLFRIVTRRQFLSRPEALCVLFSLLIAAPIMSTGFWNRFIGTMGAIPRSGDFEKMDVLSDKLWPHGENLLAGSLDNPDSLGIENTGRVSWEEVAYEKGVLKALPVLTNTEPKAVSTVRVRIPVDKGGRPQILLDEAYMISVLTRANHLGADAVYYCRIYYDDADSFAEEVFNSAASELRTFVHQTGFQRFGVYGMSFATTVREAVWVEFGLQGEGRLELVSPRFRSVRALENVYRGRSTVTESEWSALTPNEQARFVMEPDNMLSLAGLKYLLTGYIPLAEWKDTIPAWFAFIALVLTGTFSIAVIMRRQWIQNERFPLPVAQIPITLIGGELEGQADIGSSLWGNRMMWIGFGSGLFWCLLRGWALYDPDVPSPNILVYFKPYLSGAEWGDMWTNVAFQVSAVYLSLAVFMEINVLMSLVIGYFLFRAQYWFGHQQGLTILYPDFPYWDRQEIGAYLVYALLILFFTRKYLLQVFRLALFGVKRVGAAKDDEQTNPYTPEEARSYRFALSAIIFSFGAMGIWARWVSIPVAPMLVFFAVILSVGFVATKIRAECGAPAAFYFPVKLMMVMSILGGVAFFKAEGYLFATIASLLILSSVFFIIPGLQMELLHLGRGLRVPGRHLAAACMMGVIGGFLIGGWVYLSSFYALGQDGVQSAQPFLENPMEMQPYALELTKANSSFQLEGKEESAETDPAIWGFLYAGGLTGVVTVLRQIFAGFWFHPVGIILGPSRLLQFAWGSCLVAAAIRFLVLRLGGAVTVRQKLLPFFVGVFISAVTAYAIFGVITGYLSFFEPTAMRYEVFF